MSVNRVYGEEKLQKSEFPVNYSKGKRSGNRKRGNGKDTIFTGFKHYKMDDKQQGSIAELKDYQMGCSWFPPTPANPGLTSSETTYNATNSSFVPNFRNNIDGRPYIFSSETTYNATSSSFVPNFRKKIDDRQYIFSTETTYNATNSSFVPNFRNNIDGRPYIFSSETTYNATSSSFVPNFRKKIDDRQYIFSTETTYNATNSSFFPNFRTNIDGRPYKITSENPSLGKFAVESNCMPNITSGARCTHSRPFFDLNFLPSISAEATSQVVPSQFEPVTPEKTTKVDDRQQLGIPNLSINEMLGIKVVQETSIKRVELEEIHQNKVQSQLDVDRLCKTMSTQLEENHKPDMGGTWEVDLIKTPQQKPRRKKHRPKVIIEGQSKITPKPRVKRLSDLQETTKGKRRNVPIKGVNNPTAATPFKREINETDTITKPSSAKGTMNGKRKYVRREEVNTPAAITLDQDAYKTTYAKTVRQTRNSCRRSLKVRVKELKDQNAQTDRAGNTRQ